MNRLFRKTIIVLLATVWSTAVIEAQSVNMNRYITLTVKQGQQIKLNLAADVAGTPIKIISGDKEQTVTVSTEWTGEQSYLAGAAVMTIYGDVRQFDCSGNGAKITSLDASYNTQLTLLNCGSDSIKSLDISRNTRLMNLRCYDNRLTLLDVSKNTELEWIYCYKNALTALDLRYNARLKWLFCYENALTSLDIGNNRELTELDCSGNLLTSLDVSCNTKLTSLFCYDNRITSFDISNNMELTGVFCYKNSLTSLAVGNNTQLKNLNCSHNRLTSLDIKQNTLLNNLNCSENSILSLDVGNNTELTFLSCYKNRLTMLDINYNTQLKYLSCYGNNFTTAAFDNLFCSLPDRNGKAAGRIDPAFDTASPDNGVLLAANGSNAVAQNWEIMYSEDESDITGFTGTHQCGGGTGIDEAGDLPAFVIYPNPVKDILNIVADKPVHSIRIYNVYGTEVAHSTDTNSIDVSHLPAGVYMVRADGRVTMIIKK